MKSGFKIAILTAVMLLLFGSAWVSFSAQKQCPAVAPKAMSNKDFMSTHGLTQKNLSLWMREHSIKHLGTYSAVPQKCGSINTAPAAEGK